jgi:hypothetical protein
VRHTEDEGLRGARGQTLSAVRRRRAIARSPGVARSGPISRSEWAGPRRRPGRAGLRAGDAMGFLDRGTRQGTEHVWRPARASDRLSSFLFSFSLGSIGAGYSVRSGPGEKTCTAWTPSRIAHAQDGNRDGGSLLYFFLSFSRIDRICQKQSRRSGAPLQLARSSLCFFSI